ncbi:hypothetical protein TRAPUB_6328 [Trametes pubescens]|uniref:Uncharacterized protein n=1 Tax=Trametes pubescens TaxID=154538 RepID=A0A1M2V635_TRAPU|nr:hypothetical protein TRAPUB_6328 [Trametes pubescens]
MQALDPELAALLPTAPTAASEGPQRPPTIAEARAQCEQYVIAPHKAYQEPLLPPKSAYTLQDEAVAVTGGEIVVRCVVPVVEDMHATFPVLVNIHGGGWSVGSIELDDYFLRKLSVDLKLATVVQNQPLLKADLTKGFLVGGQSAGANLVAVLAHEARDDPFFAGPGRQLTGQVVREPLVVHPDVYPDE